MAQSVQRRPFGLLILGTLIGTVVGVLLGSIYAPAYAWTIGGAVGGALMGAAVDTICGRRDTRGQMALGGLLGCVAAGLPMFWLQTLPAMIAEVFYRRVNNVFQAILYCEGHVILLLLVVLVGGILGAALAVACALLTDDRAAFRAAVGRSMIGYAAGLAIAMAIVVIDYYFGYQIDRTAKSSMWAHISFHTFTFLGGGLLSAMLWGLPATSLFQRRSRRRTTTTGNEHPAPNIAGNGDDDELIDRKTPQEKAAILARMAQRAAQQNGA